MGTDSIQLSDQVAVLRRRWRVLTATVLVAVAVGVGLSLLQTPTYVAETDILLTPTSVTIDGTSEVSPEQISTEAAAVTAYSVAEQVIDEVGLDEEPKDLVETVTVAPDPDGAAVLTVTASRGSADGAATVANAFASSYLESQAERSSAQLEALSLRIAELDARIADLNDEIVATLPPGKGPLIAQLRGLQSQRAVLLAAEAEGALSEEATESGEVVRPAIAPSAPASPQPIRDGALAAALGLLLGIGLVFLREYFDDKVRAEGALREALANRPVLGRIPHLKKAGTGRLAMLMEPQSAAGEAYRALGVNMRFLLAGSEATTAGPGNRQTGRVLLIASAHQGEGKTVTAANLAVVAATAGLQVALVDADLRRPRISGLFGLGSVSGLTDMLAGGHPLGDVQLDVGVDNLRVLPAGTVPPNPAQLIASAGMRAVITELAAKADLVIVDSPALLAVADALELVPLADLTVLVARAKVSRRRSLRAALQRIEQVGGTVPGAVLNDVNYKTQEYTDDYGG